MTQPAVLFGGPSPEHDVSVLTGLQAARALADEGRSVTGIYWDKAGAFHQVDATTEAKAYADGAPRDSRSLRLIASADGGFVAEGRGGLLGGGKGRELELTAVLNCCHGGPGEDGTIQGAFDIAGISYTGPTVAGAALGMDKLAFGTAVTSAGLPSLPRALVTSDDPPFDGPYIVKPRFGGSSIGIHVMSDWKAVQSVISGVHYKRGAVVEPYRAESVDLNIAMRSFPELQLSAVEKPLRSKGSSEILGYGDKYLGGEGMASAPRELPAEIDSALEQRLRDIAMRVAAVAGVRGLARLDFLMDGDDLYVNEINTIPGSLARYLWIDPPIPFGRLLNEMLTEAETRPTHHYDATGADGTALRSAGSIASKLA